MKEHRDYWSDCGQIFFHYGKGYGLTSNLLSICLGMEDETNKFFETGELRNNLHSMQRQTLMEILDYRKEQGIGTDIGGASVERAGDHEASRGKSKATRPVTSRERFSLYTPRAKSKSLLG